MNQFVDIWSYNIYINRCEQAIFLGWLICCYFLCDNLILHCNSCTLVSHVNKSLVAPGCLRSLHHHSSSTFSLLINVSWGVICILLISAFHPDFIHPVSFISILQGGWTTWSTIHTTAAVRSAPPLPYFIPAGSQGSFVPDCWRMRIPHYPVNCTFIWQDRGERATPGIIKL